MQRYDDGRQYLRERDPSVLFAKYTKIGNLSSQVTVLGGATNTVSLEAARNTSEILVFTNKSIYKITKWSASFGISQLVNGGDASVTAGTYPNITVKNNLSSGNYIKFIY